VGHELAVWVFWMDIWGLSHIHARHWGTHHPHVHGS
jgi:hypothetical protein